MPTESAMIAATNTRAVTAIRYHFDRLTNKDAISSSLVISALDRPLARELPRFALELYDGGGPRYGNCFVGFFDAVSDAVSSSMITGSVGVRLRRTAPGGIVKAWSSLTALTRPCQVRGNEAFGEEEENLGCDKIKAIPWRGPRAGAVRLRP
jgi:hypothetical protein